MTCPTCNGTKSLIEDMGECLRAVRCPTYSGSGTVPDPPPRPPET